MGQLANEQKVQESVRGLPVNGVYLKLKVVSLSNWFKKVLLTILGKQYSYSDRKDWSVNFGDGHE